MQEAQSTAERRRGTSPAELAQEANAVWGLRDHRALYDTQKTLLEQYARQGCSLPYYAGWEAGHFQEVCRLLQEKEREETLDARRGASQVRLRGVSGIGEGDRARAENGLARVR